MSENVITVSFAENSAAYEAFTNLKKLWGQGEVSVRSAAIVERDESGHMNIKDQVEDPDLTVQVDLVPAVETVTGGLVGSALTAISSTVRPGQTVVLAHVSEQSEEVVDGAMARLGGRVLRRSVHEVEAEIAAADEGPADGEARGA